MVATCTQDGTLCPGRTAAGHHSPSAPTHRDPTQGGSDKLQSLLTAPGCRRLCRRDVDPDRDATPTGTLYLRRTKEAMVYFPELQPDGSWVAQKIFTKRIPHTVDFQIDGPEDRLYRDVPISSSTRARKRPPKVTILVPTPSASSWPSISGGWPPAPTPCGILWQTAPGGSVMG